MTAGDRVDAAAVADGAWRTWPAVAPVDRRREVARVVARVGVREGGVAQRRGSPLDAAQTRRARSGQRRIGDRRGAGDCGVAAAVVGDRHGDVVAALLRISVAAGDRVDTGAVADGAWRTWPAV